MSEKRRYTKSARPERLDRVMKKIASLEASQEKVLIRIGALREKAQKIQNKISQAEPKVG